MYRINIEDASVMYAERRGEIDEDGYVVSDTTHFDTEQAAIEALCQNLRSRYDTLLGDLHETSDKMNRIARQLEQFGVQ